MLMIDIDHFKRVNDTYGHAVGDEVLKELARLVTSCIRRPADLAARYGGEEFAVILPGTDNDGAAAVAEAIRAACENALSELPRFTVSIGVKAARLRPGDRLKQFQSAADKALYQAKCEGRNRVMVAA